MKSPLTTEFRTTQLVRRRVAKVHVTALTASQGTSNLRLRLIVGLDEVLFKADISGGGEPSLRTLVRKFILL